MQVMQHSLFSEYKTTWRFKIEKNLKKENLFIFHFRLRSVLFWPLMQTIYCRYFIETA